MKTNRFFLTLVFAVMVLAVTNSNAQVYLKVPPTAPKSIKKPARDSKYEVWVSEDWDLIYNNKYVYRAGYWAFPPTLKSVYIPGYWKKTPKGYSRVSGYWETPH
jgi:hypothetical protein